VSRAARPVISAAIRGGAAVAANIAAIDAARAAGAKRVLYTSHQAASPDSLFAPQLTHAATESYPSASGEAFTALRNGFYATTLGHHIGAALATGRLVAPEDGPVSWTAHDDLADAAAAALTEDGALDGVTAPLTGPELFTFEDVAGLLGDITGRTVRRVVVADEEWKASAVAAGMPAPAADFTLGMFRAAPGGGVRGHRPDPRHGHRAPAPLDPVGPGIDPRGPLNRSRRPRGEAAGTAVSRPA
jgi:uncharacterized protein YbjT (DUF2867 family)